MADGLADLFRRLTAGVYVVGVAVGERRNAFTAAWVVQVSFAPPLLAVAVNPENASHPILCAGGVFSVNVLGREQIELARQFGTRSGRDVDKLAGTAWRPGRTGAPILDDALAHLECRLVRRVPAGDHELMVGEVVGGAVVSPGAEPLTYAATGDLDGSRALYPDGL